MKKNALRRGFTGAVLVVAIFLVCILASCAGFGEYKRKIADIRISMADFVGIPVGTYYGEYDAVLVAAKVQVIVEPVGIVKEIQLIEHKNDRGSKAEAIVPKIVREQTLLVDTVSGATNSSKVIQKAIQNALEGAQ